MLQNIFTLNINAVALIRLTTNHHTLLTLNWADKTYRRLYSPVHPASQGENCAKQ